MLAAMLLPLGGCYVPPEGQPGYGPQGYPASAGYPPGYPSPVYSSPGGAYPGYDYNGGEPTLIVEGSTVPLVLYGGGWGYWDGRHEWHRAPDEVRRHLEQERASHGDFRPGGEGFPRGHFEDRERGGGPFPGGFHGNDQPRLAAPGGGQNWHGDQNSHGDRQRPGAPAGSPPAGQNIIHVDHPGPAAAPRPAAPSREEHQRGRDCPPGQRC